MDLADGLRGAASWWAGPASKNPIWGATRVTRSAGVLLLVTLLWACSAEPPLGDLDRIQDDQYRIGNPSRDRALATGIGCAGSQGDALGKAQDIAQFNLRTLTGAARYRVQYRTLREFQQPGQSCMEVEAKAVPLRTR